MDERGKAIPLQRTRERTAPARRAAEAPPPAWRTAVTTGTLALAEPPRQLWLAAIGTTALTLGVIRAGWTRLVAEGEAAQRWLLDRTA